MFGEEAVLVQIMIIFWVFGFLVCGIVDVITNINTLVFSLKKIKLSMGWFIFFFFGIGCRLYDWRGSRIGTKKNERVSEMQKGQF
jgi:p-aminobenzoyl-glutamate transporter AbgT